MCHSMHGSKKQHICEKVAHVCLLCFSHQENILKQLKRQFTGRKIQIDIFLWVHSSGFCLQWGFHGGKYFSPELDILRWRRHGHPHSSSLSSVSQPGSGTRPCMQRLFPTSHMAPHMIQDKRHTFSLTGRRSSEEQRHSMVIAANMVLYT